MNGVVDYIDAVHEAHFDDGAPPEERGRRVHDLFGRHETALLSPLLEYLTDHSKVRIMGPTDLATKVPTVAIVPARHPQDVAVALSEHKVMAGAGDFYAVRLIEAMGQPADPGVLRLSFVHYTSAADIEQLVTALDATL
jgi:selenocysteine lyase/cysteine desulfurase